MSEMLHIADLEFEVRRGPRRKTLGLTVDRAGELIVHAPDSATEEELHRWVQRKLLWVHRKLAQKQEMNGAARTPEFVSGESFYYLGKNFRLRVVNKGAVPLKLVDEWFLLRRKDCPDAGRHFRDWYLAAGTPWLSNRVDVWVPRVNARPARIRVGDLGFHWGSCGRKGMVYFNWRLLQLPVRLIDYVVVHELIHLIEHNHGRQFWRIMERTLPDWRERKETIESGWQGFTAFGLPSSSGEVGPVSGTDSGRNPGLLPTRPAAQRGANLPEAGTSSHPALSRRTPEGILPTG
jgi:predicted metal-dependent hydrolase